MIKNTHSSYYRPQAGCELVLASPVKDNSSFETAKSYPITKIYNDLFPVLAFFLLFFLARLEYRPWKPLKLRLDKLISLALDALGLQRKNYSTLGTQVEAEVA